MFRVPVTAALCLLIAGPTLAGQMDPLHALQLTPVRVEKTQAPGDRLMSITGGLTVQKAACCKVCRKGKACGNSCISRSYSCHKPPGCACQGR